MIEKHEGIRKEIISLNNSKKYADSNKKCYEFIELLLFTSKNINDDLWFCYYMLAYNYYMMREYSLAIENGKYATFVIKNYNLVNFNKTILLLANCYRDRGNTRDAIKMYKHCAHYYKKTNNNISRVLCLYNIAKLLNMKVIMVTLENLFANIEFKDETGML